MKNYENMCLDSVPVKKYIEDSIGKTEKFQERYEKYKPDTEKIGRLKKYSEDIVVYGFSADWCSDYYRNVPVIAQISEETGIEVRIFGNLMRGAKSSTRIWACPPSPEKVNEFNITKIPTFILMNGTGKELGKITENSPEGETLEEPLLKILEEIN